MHRNSLPLSMPTSFNGVPTAQSAPPAMPQHYQEKIPKLMFEVIFENDDIMVLRGILTCQIYTIDKSRGISIDEPDDREIVIYHHLHQLGITDQHLNVFHYDTLIQLFEVGRLSIKPDVVETNPASAAIEYAMTCDDGGFDFLRYWNEGEFQTLRDNWENIPDEVFIGADSQFKPGK